MLSLRQSSAPDAETGGRRTTFCHSPQRPAECFDFPRKRGTLFVIQPVHAAMHLGSHVVRQAGVHFRGAAEISSEVWADCDGSPLPKRIKQGECYLRVKISFAEC